MLRILPSHEALISRGLREGNVSKEISIYAGVVAAVIAVLFVYATFSPTVHAASITPSILGTLPVVSRLSSAIVTSDSFAYSVPSGGQNALLIILIALGDGNATPPAATQNSAPMTCERIAGPTIRAVHFYCYLAAPTSGTFQVSWSNPAVFQYSVFTLQDAAQTNPIDVSSVSKFDQPSSWTSSISTSVTTTIGNTLLLDNVIGSISTTHSYGVNQTEIYNIKSPTAPLGDWSGSYKAAAASPGLETMTRNFSPPPGDNNDDLAVIAVKPADNVVPPSPCASSDSGGITITICNNGSIANSTIADASTGGNEARGSFGGDGNKGGDVESDDGGYNNGGVSTGNGGKGGNAGPGGSIFTGLANSTAVTMNMLNMDLIRIGN